MPNPQGTKMTHFTYFSLIAIFSSIFSNWSGIAGKKGVALSGCALLGGNVKDRVAPSGGSGFCQIGQVSIEITPPWMRVAASVERLTSAVHSCQGFARVNDIGFQGCQRIEPCKHLWLRGEIGCQSRVGSVVTRFGLEEALIEGRELLVGNMLSQSPKPFARAGFYQSCNEQAVDRAIRFLLANQVVKLSAVIAWLQSSKANFSLLEQVDDQVEVLEFLTDDFRHFSAQIEVLHVGENQVKGRAGRFFFAVRMVDQDFIKVLVDLFQPPIGRLGLEVQHRVKFSPDLRK